MNKYLLLSICYIFSTAIMAEPINQGNISIEWIVATNKKNYLQIKNISKDVVVKNIEVKLNNIIIAKTIKEEIKPYKDILIPQKNITKHIRKNSKLKISWDEITVKHEEKELTLN